MAEFREFVQLDGTRVAVREESVQAVAEYGQTFDHRTGENVDACTISFDAGHWVQVRGSYGNVCERLNIWPLPPVAESR